MQHPNSLFNQAFYLINSNDLKTSNEDYYTLIHTNPDFNKNSRFTFSATKDNYKQAIRLFEEFISIKPNCKFAYNYCGIAKIYLNDLKEAIDDFTKATSIDSNFANAYHNRAQIRILLKEYEEAIIDSSKAIILIKDNSNYYELRGHSKYHLKEYQGAIQDFTSCINLKPNNFKIILLRAFANFFIKNYENSIQDFNTVDNGSPSNFKAYSFRGRAFLELKKYKEAVEDLQIAVKIDPINLRINTSLKKAELKLYIEEQTYAEQEMTSKKQIIIDAIASMNTSLLEVVLDDYKTYQEATKETFIDKLSDLFEEFKKNNDTQLIPHQGKCNSENCENKGCAGYSFVGNVSKSYLNLIFEETENNFKDIYACSYFETNNSIKDLKSEFNIDINRDEEAHYIKTPQYIDKTNEATKALSEINTTNSQTINLEQLSYWINKYEILYERIGEYDIFQPIMKWTPFTRLYSDLKEIKDFLDTNYNKIKSAYHQYKTLETEQNKIDWILEHETFYNQIPFNLTYRLTLDKVVLKCKIDIKTTILFCGQEFIDTYHFINHYDVNNKSLLKKFAIYNDEEFTTKFNDRNIKDIQEDLYLLSYHIHKRKELEKIGVQIPYNIIRRSL